jgi:hypothetical protein
VPLLTRNAADLALISDLVQLRSVDSPQVPATSE